jgi:coenzyme F420 hydrogenase subunit beta
VSVSYADTTLAPAEDAREPQVLELFRTVVDGGYCIGCGACAAVESSPIRMELDPRGRWLPSVDPHAEPDALDAPVLDVCPFTNHGPDEDALAGASFPAAVPHPRVGRLLGAYAGHATDPELRARGSSGGIGTWILSELLERGLVDEVLHVRPRRPSAEDPRLFAYDSSGQVADVRERAKSRYYPVEMSEVLRRVRERPGRYAIVGVPCFVKAVRRLARTHAEVADRVRYTMALFCGHQKSTRFAELLAWQLGVRPDRLEAIDFRHKLPDRPANRYGVEARDSAGATAFGPTDELLGGNWGEGMLKLRPCDFCDDVTGETADVAVGDAWLPRYVPDSRGTNVVVTRHPALEALVQSGIESGGLQLDRLSADDVAASQASGLRHRREGLAYRLARADEAGIWRPRKRVEPEPRRLDRRSRRIMDLRVALAEQSHEAFALARATGRLEAFRDRLERPLRAYRTLYAPLRWRLVMRAPAWLKRAVKMLVPRRESR